MNRNGPALPTVNKSLVFLVVIVPADAGCLPCIDCDVSTAATKMELPGNLLRRPMKQNRKRPSQKSNLGRAARERCAVRVPTLRRAAGKRRGGILPPRM